jgi:hypothetical protein
VNLKLDREGRFFKAETQAGFSQNFSMYGHDTPRSTILKEIRQIRDIITAKNFPIRIRPILTFEGCEIQANYQSKHHMKIKSNSQTIKK